MVRKSTAYNENRKGLHYSEHEDKIILLMHSQGYSLDEIAEKLGHNRSASGISSRIQLLLSGKKKISSNVSDAEALKIAKLHLNGKSSSEICCETGRSDRSVARYSRLADGIKKIITED